MIRKYCPLVLLTVGLTIILVFILSFSLFPQQTLRFAIYRVSPRSSSHEITTTINFSRGHIELERRPYGSGYSKYSFFGGVYTENQHTHFFDYESDKKFTSLDTMLFGYYHSFSSWRFSLSFIFPSLFFIILAFYFDKKQKDQ